MESWSAPALRTRPGKAGITHHFYTFSSPPFGHERKLGQEDIDIGVIDDAVLRRLRRHDCRCPRMERERRKVLAGRSRQFVSGALRLVRFFEQSGRLQHPGELDEGLRLLEELLVVEATGDIRKVSLCLGHASIQSTEIYLRRDPTGKLDVLAARLPPVNRKGSFKEAPDRLLAILKDARAQ